MNVEKLKAKSFDEIRALYKIFLNNQNISESTVNTAYSDTFYLWRKGNRELFWDTVTSPDFEEIAKNRMKVYLEKHSASNIERSIFAYVSHMRRFRLFLEQGEINKSLQTEASEKIKKTEKKQWKKVDKNIPQPSEVQMELYLQKWDALEIYHLQEDALNKLFFELAPQNTDVTDILLKVSTLNDFYSTNIFSTYPVAKHIKSLNIDDRLWAGDVTLVDDIQSVAINGKVKKFYSFATKYCSHHNPLDYPIYDSYVDEVLRYFRDKDRFLQFKTEELKEYKRFKEILNCFRAFYGLEKYNLKQVDQYLWQLGKDYFPKDYGKRNELEKD